MFKDRTEAGERLADRLERMALPHPLVLALPRGGVPVAVPVARRLRAPLDLALVRKIGMPGHPELAAGAILSGPGGEEIVWHEALLHSVGLTPDDFVQTLAERRRELDERRARYLRGRASRPVQRRSVIVVDDGIATGMTVRAALAGLRRLDPARIVLAVPVAPREALHELRPMVDELLCLDAPPGFHAVGQFYREFPQIDDAEVIAALDAVGDDARDDPQGGSA